ncbi:unnamed protein product [Mesocestoides corti]|uniref:Fibronectin type-III domain-containing protein n=1 Tax=Mesocestoides corti TaxID=53468 RepID=A0A0R3U7N2_MESCO|nr:unnamed protein product [Mesocestoides corti]
MILFLLVLQNVRAETLPNNSMVVTWTADSGPIKKIYRVIVADSKGTTRYQDIWAASQDKVSVMFDNLRAYENYTVQIRTFHGGRYVKLASIRNQVLLNTPNAPRLNDSTSSSIVLSFDRLKEDKLHDFQYYAEEYRQNQTQDPDARSVLCDSTTATCRIDGLQSNMGYRFKIKACLPRRSQTCSLKSRQSELVHTKPETVQMSSADSIAATYVKQPSLANLAVFVKITADRGETVETREAACDNEAATCRISGLEANRAYTVSLRACSANPEPRCSQWSDPTTAYTTPSIPDAPASKISDSDSITVTYSKEPSLVNLTTFVKASPLDDKAVEMREVACDAEETTCRINGLAPNRAYAVSLRTCSANPKPRCSQWSDPTNMYTAPSSPNAPWLNDSTSSSIVLSFDRLKDDELSDFQYYAEEYRQNQTQDPDTQSVLCDNATATCRFDGLHSNTGYRFVLKACATKPSKLCSVNSRESDVVFTKPETPDAPALKAFGASVITVTYANKPGPGNVTMFARAAPADGGALEGREIVCNRERSTCRISGLKADSAYAVSLRACSANPKPRCSKWSDAAAAHTTLSRPRNLLLENVSSDHVDVSWDEPRFSNGAIEKFVVFARDQQNHSAPCVFGTSEFKCSLISLQPTTRYTVSVSACSPTGICGAAARKSIWTRPEKPSNLVISRQEVNSIKCKWQGLSSANKFIHYEVSLHYANNEIRIKTSTVPAHNQATSFSYLHAHTGYSIHLRACANDDSGRPQNCGEAIKTSGYTRPSKPSALTVIQRTSSTLLLHYRKQLKDNEDSHFNYTVTYKSEDNGEDKTGVCNTSTKTCNVTGLAANSKVTASLTACCKHNLCSPPSPEIRVYTKAGACENLHVKSLTTTSIEASWSKPRVNADALTNYEAIATDPQGRQSFCVVPAINQERLVCTFHGLSPCLEYAISVSACARLNDCGLPISMNASTLPAGKLTYGICVCVCVLHCIVQTNHRYV